MVPAHQSRPLGLPKPFGKIIRAFRLYKNTDYAFALVYNKGGLFSRILTCIAALIGASSPSPVTTSGCDVFTKVDVPENLHTNN